MKLYPSYFKFNKEIQFIIYNNILQKQNLINKIENIPFDKGVTKEKEDNSSKNFFDSNMTESKKDVSLYNKLKFNPL